MAITKLLLKGKKINSPNNKTTIIEEIKKVAGSLSNKHVQMGHPVFTTLNNIYSFEIIQKIIKEEAKEEQKRVKEKINFKNKMNNELPQKLSMKIKKNKV